MKISIEFIPGNDPYKQLVLTPETINELMFLENAGEIIYDRLLLFAGALINSDFLIKVHHILIHACRKWCRDVKVDKLLETGYTEEEIVLLMQGMPQYCKKTGSFLEQD
jgi:uncharacterized protein with ATP-grasp and redox domains